MSTGSRHFPPKDDTRCGIDLAAMLALPGIVQPVIPDAEHIERMKKTILKLTQDAMEQLKVTRLEEGKTLVEDFLGNCRMSEDLERFVSVKTLWCESITRSCGNGSRNSLSQAQLRIDNDLLAREAAIYADRSDINEEITRLDSHLQQFETPAVKRRARRTEARFHHSGNAARGQYDRQQGHRMRYRPSCHRYQVRDRPHQGTGTERRVGRDD